MDSEGLIERSAYYLESAERFLKDAIAGLHEGDVLKAQIQLATAMKNAAEASASLASAAERKKHEVKPR